MYCKIYRLCKKKCSQTLHALLRKEREKKREILFITTTNARWRGICYISRHRCKYCFLLVGAISLPYFLLLVFTSFRAINGGFVVFSWKKKYLTKLSASLLENYTVWKWKTNICVGDCIVICYRSHLFCSQLSKSSQDPARKTTLALWGRFFLNMELEIL